MTGIYKIESPKAYIYIGQSSNIYNRWATHMNYKKFKNTPPFLAWSFNMFGVENHKFEIIEVCEKQLLLKREKYYIKAYDTIGTDHGLNINGRRTFDINDFIIEIPDEK